MTLRPVLVSLAVAGAALGAVTLARPEGPSGPDYTLRTPFARPGAAPQEAPAAAARHEITRAEARRLKPLLAGWSRALRSGEVARASAYFALPATIAMVGESVQYRTPAEVRAFNRALPCGLRLLDVGRAGRYVVGTFRLTARPGRVCDAPGETVRIAFLVRGGKFMEWRRLANAPEADPEPQVPPAASPPPLVA